MRGNFGRDDKRVRKGPYEIRITTYYLSKHKASIRVEVRRLKSVRGSTVEIELLRGDDVIILKHTYKNTVLQNPTKKEIDKIVDEYIKYAEEHKMI